MKKIFILAAALVAMKTTVQAQTELSNASAVGRGGVANTFVHDYQAIGINPANLSRGTSTLAFTFLEGGVGGELPGVYAHQF